MKKKGDISIQVIIVAILALLVLVILSVMFITKTGTWSTQVNSCESKGGTCKASCADSEQNYFFGNNACSKSTSGYKCCLPSSVKDGGGLSNI